ncbi:MAG TPA: hypothetical protein VGM67_12515 [Gemmatimonadaceae bacterium]|jgi:hypothetical protein
MRSAFLSHSLILAGCVTALALPVGAQAPAQQATPAKAQASPMSQAEINNMVKINLAIDNLRDSADVQMSMIGNKKDEVLKTIRAQLQSSVAGVYKANGTTEADYNKKTYVLSSNAEARRLYDSTIAKVTGVALPGQLVGPAPKTLIKVPDGAVGVHIGHVVNSFADTPDKQGLLPVAIAEAKTAAQHAALAAKAPTNLDGMKLHAGHVINAIDPTIETKGPGLGYGVKKAAMGIATHINLAATSPGASKNVIMHAEHIKMSAENTVARCDQIVAIAKQVQAATSAPAAAALVNQLVSLTSQLMTGVDANNDGKVTWEKGEGGLDQVQQHVDLMLKAEEGGR